MILAQNWPKTSMSYCSFNQSDKYGSMSDIFVQFITSQFQDMHAHNSDNLFNNNLFVTRASDKAESSGGSRGWARVSFENKTLVEIKKRTPGKTTCLTIFTRPMTSSSC